MNMTRLEDVAGAEVYRRFTPEEYAWRGHHLGGQFRGHVIWLEEAAARRRRSHAGMLVTVLLALIAGAVR